MRWEVKGGGALAGTEAPKRSGGIQARRALLVVALAVAAGLAVWFWASRPDDAKVVGPVGPSRDAAAGRPDAPRLRIMDVLAGIPGASTPERSEGGRVTWTSTFTLAGGEPGEVIMQSDPADLSYASITVPLRPVGDPSAEKIMAMARRFLRNVAPEFDGAFWLHDAMTTVAGHPEQTPTKRTDRATFRVGAVGSRKDRRLRVEMRLNRGAGQWSDASAAPNAARPAGSSGPSGLGMWSSVG